MVNMGLAMNLAAFSRAANPNAAQIVAKAATAAAVAGGNEFARDKMAKRSSREKAMRLVGAKVSRKKVTDKAGVTKPAAAKKA